ncbi:Ankyrin repeat and SAM domain-containing protein 3 [Geodia barretti]|uniref:NAD(+) ADP-ribosyltransferase n=2 Tax=Geodia barretti TaxID=519541 RepID=A0AA35S8J5_GEOBA|nr:Ankyrin repeat and SAM domain-containing protein 3 [Geodia barretti]
MYAAYVSHDTVVNLLLEAKADPNKGTPGGLTPLMVAARCGNESICYFLIQNGAKIDPQDETGCTALFHAVRQGHQTASQLLLESGANLEIREKVNGLTPLMVAALEGDEIIVDVLIACGASLQQKNNEGLTARSLALNNNHVRIVTLFDNTARLLQEEEDVRMGGPADDDSEMLGGEKEMEAYRQSMAVKRAIQMQLGHRYGPRWSIPELRRGSMPVTSLLQERKLRYAMSLPESEFPPMLMGGDMDPRRGGNGIESLATVPEENDRLSAFLQELGLGKYEEVFQRQAVDYKTLLSCSDNDLKNLGINLLGPRRKLSIAIAELKEKEEKPQRGVSSLPSSINRGPGRGGEGEDGVDGGGGYSKSSERGKGRGRGSRPQLYKQPSTELQAAYHQAMERVEQLESQLTQEHSLRSAADSYLLELQQSRQRAASCLAGLRDGQSDTAAHCNAVKTTNVQLSKEVAALRTLSYSPSPLPPLSRIHSELVALSSRLSLEVEALSRAVDVAQQHSDSLAYSLLSSSPS